MKIVVIVQARMTSSRLPGKVLLPLGDISVLGQVLTRCNKIRGIHEVCCAIPYGSLHDILEIEAKKFQASVFRGSENDVLSRYYEAAKATHAAVIMRITSDCPLIDPIICSQVVNLYLSSNLDYCCNNMPPSWPHGLDCEIFSFDALEKAYQQSSRAEEREHVSIWIRNTLRCSNLTNPAGNHFSLRITLDTPKDYVFIKSIFDNAPKSVELNYQYLISNYLKEKISVV